MTDFYEVCVGIGSFRGMLKSRRHYMRLNFMRLNVVAQCIIKRAHSEWPTFHLL